MRLAAFLAVFALASIASPWVLDAWDSERAFADFSDRDARRRARLLAAPAPDADAAVREMNAVAAKLGLGRPLPGVLVSLTSLAARAAVEIAVLAVQAPVEIPRETPGGPRPWLREHRVRVAVTGRAANVHRFVKLLPELEGPFRIEAARLDQPPVPEGSEADPDAHLELALRVLVEAPN